MGGNRRIRANEVDGSPRVKRATARTRRIEARLGLRFAEAKTSAERLAATADYVRAGAKSAHRVDPVRTDHLLEEVIRRLRTVGAELLEIGGKTR